MNEPTEEQLKQLHTDIMSGLVMTVEVKHYRRLTDNLNKSYDANKAKNERIEELEAELHNYFEMAAKSYTACGNYQQRIKGLESEIQEVSNQLVDLYNKCNETTAPEVYGTVLGLHERLEQALKD